MGLSRQIRPSLVKRSNRHTLSTEWVRGLGPPRRHSLPSEVIDAIEKVTGHSLHKLFFTEEGSQPDEQVYDNGWTFFRSVAELEAVIQSASISIEEFAPFAVDYNIESKRSAKNKYVRGPVDVYGVCFAGLSADPHRILAWDGDRDYVYSWQTFEEFRKRKGAS